MFRKLSILYLLIAIFAVILWSTVVLAAEDAQKSREAQIQEIREQIRVLEKEMVAAQDRDHDEEKVAELKKAL